MTRHRIPAAGLAALLLLAACTGGVDEPTAAPTTDAATPAPPSPTPGGPASTPRDPSASPATSPSPDGTASPSPGPSPSPSASPDLTEAAALAAARRRQADRGECDEGIATDAHRVVVTVDQVLLVHVVCFVGAYQPTGELLAWDGVDLEPLPVEQWQSGSVVDRSEVVGFVEGAPGSTTVSNQVRYRGLGDCGLQQRWTFDGSALRLDLAREQECTDDGEFTPPSQWPVVYER